MLYNIHTGRGVAVRQNEEIVILVSSLPHLEQQGIPFVFTNMHAYYQWAAFYSDLSDLDKIDWRILQSRDFTRDPNDPMKFERYQAEALVHNHCPISGLIGVVCYTDALKQKIEKQLAAQGHKLNVQTRAGLYFQ